MTLLESAKKVKELLSDKANWTQKAFARDKNNAGIDHFSPALCAKHQNACSWCLVGTVYKVNEGIDNTEINLQHFHDWCKMKTAGLICMNSMTDVLTKT